MTTPGPKQRLLRRSEEAALRQGLAQKRQRRRREPPGPGDLFRFPETAELQWAVLEQGPEGRLRIVAADVHPAIGSADVAVPPESTCGALSLRCRFDVWLAADDFDVERRTGSLEPAVFELARQKRAALDGHRPVGSPAEWDTDREPEYLDLVKELEWARAALRERQVPAKKPVHAAVPARRPARRWGSTSRPYALAAMVLLVVSLALGVGMFGQLRQVERLARELERRAGEDGRDEPLVDLPFVWMSPRIDVRGPAKTLTLPHAASYLLLILEVSDPEPYPRYRLDIRKRDPEATFYSRVVEKAGISEVSVALPRRWLGAGEYELVLYGLRGSQAEPVGEYALILELE